MGAGFSKTCRTPNPSVAYFKSQDSPWVPDHSPVNVPGIYATVQVPVHPSPGSQNAQQVCSNLITMMIEYHVCPPAHEQKSLPRSKKRENTKQTDQTCPMVFFLVKDDNE